MICRKMSTMKTFEIPKNIKVEITDCNGWFHVKAPGSVISFFSQTHPLCETVGNPVNGFRIRYSESTKILVFYTIVMNLFRDTVGELLGDEILSGHI